MRAGLDGHLSRLPLELHVSFWDPPKGENTHQNHSKHLPGTNELTVTGCVQGESGMCQSWGAGVPSLGGLHDP